MTDQWELNRINFEGVWQGNSHWYVRRDDGELDFRQPTSVVSNTRYAISFEDADNGLWEGTGLFFAPGGAAQYALSRSTYNASGACWQFAGAGGQSSLEVSDDLGRFGHEINFFTADRARCWCCFGSRIAVIVVSMLLVWLHPFSAQ